MSKSSERFDFKNMAEAMDINGSFKHYINNDVHNDDKTCWDSLIDRTKEQFKFGGQRMKVLDAPDHIKELIKDNKVEFYF